MDDKLELSILLWLWKEWFETSQFWTLSDCNTFSCVFATIQPLLSAALLDRLIHHDRNIPPEYTSPENYNEIQVVLC